MKGKIQVNGVTFVAPTPKEITVALAETVVANDLQYWSKDALVQLLTGLVDLMRGALEYLRSLVPSSRKTQYTRVIRNLENLAKRVRFDKMDWMDLLTEIYNLAV